MNQLRLLAACFLLAIPCCAAPKQKPVAKKSHATEDINERFRNPNLEVEQWVERWESEKREIYANRAEIVRGLDLTPGMSIADVGSGTGLFVEPFASAVGSNGRVFALDISPRFVDHIRARAQSAGLDQVEAILSHDDSVTLPDGSVDVVFLCDTYHHFDQPQAMVRSIYRALRPGGTLAVIDFERIPGVSREWILGHVRAGKDEFRAEIEAEGFAFLDEIRIDGFDENYFLRFERR